MPPRLNLHGNIAGRNVSRQAVHQLFRCAENGTGNGGKTAHQTETAPQTVGVGTPVVSEQKSQKQDHCDQKTYGDTCSQNPSEYTLCDLQNARGRLMGEQIYKNSFHIQLFDKIRPGLSVTDQKKRNTSFQNGRNDNIL